MNTETMRLVVSEPESASWTRGGQTRRIILPRLLIATLLISIIFLSPRAIAFSQEEENAIKKKGFDAINSATVTPLNGDRQKLVYQRYSIEFAPPKDYTLKEVANPGATGMLYVLEG